MTYFIDYVCRWKLWDTVYKRGQPLTSDMVNLSSYDNTTIIVVIVVSIVREMVQIKTYNRSIPSLRLYSASF